MARSEAKPGWVSRFLVPPIAALQFLTLVPPIIRRLFTSSEMGGLWAISWWARYWAACWVAG